MLRYILLEGKGRKISVSDKMQKGYSYELTAKTGDLSDLKEKYGFEPELSPKEMLALGVFEGKYLNDCRKEFPADWFSGAKTSDEADPQLNYFKVKSRKPLSHWKGKGWIIGDDPRGWFQWYCRAYLGRRDEKVDAEQCKRWKAFARHKAQLVKNCKKGDATCRPVQRQALLQWAYDSRKY